MAYLTGSRSSFPDEIDKIKEKYDLSPRQLQLAKRYQELKIKENRTSKEEEELNNLTIELQDFIITAEDMNKAFDVVIATQKHYRDNTIGHVNKLKQETKEYVDNKQIEMQQYVDVKQQEIQQYVNAKQQEIQEYVDDKKTEFDVEISKFQYRGEYNPSTQYYQWNVVSLDGYIYMAKQDTLGNPPSDTTYWLLMAKKGDKGDPGIGLTFRGVYDNNRAYNVEDAVILDNVIYYCIKATIGNAPPNDNYWSVFLDASAISDQIGNLDNLITENQNTLVDAINELVNNIQNAKDYADQQISTVANDLASHKAENVTTHNVSRGVANFAGNGQEVTIPHGLPVTPTSAYAFPTVNPEGYLGEVWIRMDETNLYIGNSGSFNGEMCWVAIA